MRNIEAGLKICVTLKQGTFPTTEEKALYDRNGEVVVADAYGVTIQEEEAPGLSFFPWTSVGMVFIDAEANRPSRRNA
jgi:hypothetical protein